MDYEDTSIAVSAGYLDALIHLCSTHDPAPFPLGEKRRFIKLRFLSFVSL